MSTKVEQLLTLLENTALLLTKAQVNLKKCPKHRLTRGYIETRMQSVQEYWNTFKNTHQELVKSVPKEQKPDIPYFVNEDYFLYEDLFTCILADLKDLASASTNSTQSQPGQAVSGLQPQPGDGLLKLPRIYLPSFSGVYEEWPAFQDLFSSLVHNNSSLSQVQKLHYLKSTLTGEAESLLRHVQITDDNYEHAWQTLKLRYGNKRIIVNSIMKRLFWQRKIVAQTANSIKSLLDTTTECINSLKNLNLSTDSWDPLIIFLVAQKLDPETHREWEEFAYKQSAEDLPTYNDLCSFLRSKFRTLELTTPPTRERTTKLAAVHMSTSTNAKSRSCSMCNEDHTLCHCKEFTRMQPTERCDYVKANNLCYNCLAPGHSARHCHLNMSCRICHKRHHTLVHQSTSIASPNRADNVQANHSQMEEDPEENADPEPEIKLSSHLSTGASTALLATALVPIKDEAGNVTLLRALVDPGSQATFLSERAAQMLRLKRSPVTGTVTGVGATTTTVKHAAYVELLSRHEGSFRLKVKLYIMSTRLTTQLPARTISTSTWPHLQGLLLADPSFNQPGRVDMLLGVDVCAQIMKSEVIRGPPGTPCAQNTSLGWILFGSINEHRQRDELTVMHLNLDLDDMLKQMWEHDREENGKHTANEKRCEEIYQSTTTRTENGSYVVKLPTKQEILLSPHGETRDIAMRRLYQLERRFKQDTNLKNEYVKVMEEYKDLNHMQEVPKNERNNPAVYLPHHAVVREEKETSKVRTVFNASQKGTNNVSLNEELLVGPPLQDDMRSLIMRWRMKKVCFASDVQKMYRQIHVAKEDRDLQRILWRADEKDPVKDYQLLRVTFGTASAPYLAVRTLHQLAEDEGSFNPDAAKVIKRDFYMDDLMTGKDTLEDAISLAKDIDTILKKGGFVLQKWCSNDAQFLKQFKPSQISTHVNLDITLDGTIRALGLHWNMGKDVFQYSFRLPSIAGKITKRTILADIQRLFDPLGWLAPSILLTKLLIQRLWVQGITWDEEVESTVAEEWLELREGFKYLPNIEIKRWVHTTETGIANVTVHGFCDASNRAYAAVAYLRVRTADGQVKTSLIAAKTRVASTKAKSLPRLELCGAVLLTDLLNQIKEAMDIPAAQVFAWTDSTIVLSWLFGDPARWKTYVKNRVIEILDSMGSKNWYHVQSADNPADVASRGLPLFALKNNEMWFKGPKWLSEGEIAYSRPKNIMTNLEKREVLQTNLKIEAKEEKWSAKFEMFKDLPELTRSIVYCKRFLKRKGNENVDGTITTTEIEEALQTCIKLVQGAQFEEDIRNLKTKKTINKSSKLKSLQPYLDEHEILRVGGRLRHANLSDDEKHPIILDHDSYLTSLIVDDAHLRTLHGGNQLMLGYLRSKYWILKAKKMVKSKTKNCLICAKHNAVARSQLMGDLPEIRVTPAKPFLHSGVDFAGPYQVLMSKGRGAKTNKAYIAVFVCMCTKAIHLELVGDLSSEAFVATFKRFIARRGRCAHLWSDQGRNFVGANKELAAAFNAAKLEFEGSIAETLAMDGTQWHFIPAYTPHMGGLWEAGVKSVKYHLKRILTSHLTYEELTTLLCQIEACLNSRPLTIIDDFDTDTMQPLTSGHFLIGESPISVPAPSMKNIPMSHLSRWQHMQKLLDNFWHKWQSEYLSRLQQRPKWLKKVEEYDIGQIVLIKQDNLPPGKWLMGRIMLKHPGSDGVTRVYTLKCGDHITQRSTNKLCPLPIDTN
jgi:hypothetical protein